MASPVIRGGRQRSFGKRVFDMKVDYGVEEIRRLIAGKP